MTGSGGAVGVSDRLDPARAQALEIALGRAVTCDAGQPLPPFFHHLYFWQPEPPAALGPDGHPQTGGGAGGLIPDLGLPRRMWAAGRLQWYRPLLAGVEAQRESVIEAVTRKDGRSGPLAFVTLRHDVHQRGGLALSEWQDLVYRGAGTSPATGPETAEPAQDERPLITDSTLLFRYSALTFNGHRIHYDADYARDVEGYGGLVVHGPLLAQHLMLMAQDQLGRLAAFRYRALAPLIAGHGAVLCRQGNSLWVRGADGRDRMHAEAVPG